MERTIAWLRKCRTEGFDNALADAKEILNEIDIKPVFREHSS